MRNNLSYRSVAVVAAVAVLAGCGSSGSTAHKTSSGPTAAQMHVYMIAMRSVFPGAPQAPMVRLGRLTCRILRNGTKPADEIMLSADSAGGTDNALIEVVAAVTTFCPELTPKLGG